MLIAAFWQAAQGEVAFVPFAKKGVRGNGVRDVDGGSVIEYSHATDLGRRKH